MRILILGLSAAFVLSAAVGCSDDTGTTSGSSSSGSSSGGSVSFTDDIVPILSTNCALSACHSSKESNLNFYITYDEDQMYEELLKTSPTCKTWKFISPGKPEDSMIMLKLENEQDKLPADCTFARRSEMPPGDPPGSGNALLSKGDRDLVRKWIAAGAKKN